MNRLRSGARRLQGTLAGDMSPSRSWVLYAASWLLVVGFGSPVLLAQLEAIDQSKLPDTPQVHTAYLEALSVERYAQSWSNPWAYPVAKTDVARKLTKSLATLREASDSAPDNHELRLATGLVAHFAYNLDVEAAFQPAVDILSTALQEAPDDIRGGWFLGIHECQALQVVRGMNRLLAIEASGKKLPIAFWDDYIACANVAILPAHVLRAIDYSVQAGRQREGYDTVRQIAESRYKTPDLTQTVNEHDAWISDDLKDNQVKSSVVCAGFLSSRVGSGSCRLQKFLTEPARYF
jgi:hypothetical protein